jgi:hypothetical protein
MAKMSLTRLSPTFDGVGKARDQSTCRGIGLAEQSRTPSSEPSRSAAREMFPKYAMTCRKIEWLLIDNAKAA